VGASLTRPLDFLLASHHGGPAPGRAAVPPLLPFPRRPSRGPVPPGEEEARRGGGNGLGDRLLLASRTSRATGRPLLSTSGYVCGQSSLWHVDELHANGSRRQALVSDG